MKYKLVRPISVEILERAGACKRELHRFAFLWVKYFPDFKVVDQNNSRETQKNLIHILSQCLGGIEWALEHGFIAEDKPENPFKNVSVTRFGDNWRIDAIGSDGKEWLLASLSSYGIELIGDIPEESGFPLDDKGRIKIVE